MRAFLTSRLDPDHRYGLQLTLFSVAFLLAALPFSLLLIQVVQEGPLVRLDSRVATQLHRFVSAHDPLAAFLRGITLLGSPPWLWVVVGASVFSLWRRGLVRLAVFLAVTSLLGGTLDSVAKELVDRPRPSWATPLATAAGKSFPSGHAMNSLVCYGSLLLCFLPSIPSGRRRATVAVVVLVVLAVGFSRLGLGVHYVSDVFGGYCLGAAWLAGCTAVFRIWRLPAETPPDAPLPP